MRLSTRSLARMSGSHPWWVIGGWVVLLALAGLLTSRLLSSALTTEITFASEPESKHGLRLLEERLRGPSKVTEIVAIHSDTLTVDEEAFKARVGKLQGDITALGPDVVESAVSYYQTGEPTMVSADRHSTIIFVTMAGEVDEASKHVEDLREAAHNGAAAGFQDYLTGAASISADFQHVSERDIRTGESLGVPIALVILVIVFGAVVAAFVPLIIAAVAIVAAVGTAAVIGQWSQLTFFVVNMITMMGLAVGIDYSLFIVSRYREERVRGLPKIDAISAAGDTATRAVLFSGMTVVLALLGMLLLPTTLFRSLATGAILVVVFAVLATLTLLPAVLGILGDRVNAVRLPFLKRGPAVVGDNVYTGFWGWVTRTVMRAPVLSLLLAGTVLVAAAVPYFGIRTGQAGARTLPAGLESRDGLVFVQREFPFAFSWSAQIVIDGDVNAPQTQAAIERVRAEVSRDPFWGPPTLQVNPAGDLALLSVPGQGEDVSRESTEKVKELRTEIVRPAFEGAPATPYVTGGAAFNLDFFDITDQYTPIVFVFVLGLSFLLLVVVFRSLVVPVKAIIMNLLSVGAAYGLLVLVFQHGVGAKLLGFQQVEAVEAWLPLFLFSLLFGLSMDYHVFLISRIRERYDQTGDNTNAVAFGLRSTAGLITGAALIMVAVFSGFAMGQMVMFQQLGFGASVAVLMDATIVRSVLVPASMKLLNRVNWYLPRWLEWLPDLRVEGGHGRAEAKAAKPKVGTGRAGD